MAMADAEKLALIERLDRALEQGRRIRDRAKEDAMQYVHAAESAAAAGLIGAFEGYRGTPNLVDGIPFDLAVTAGAFGTAFFQSNRETAKHFYAVGTGGLSVLFYRWAREAGQRMKQPLPGASASSGGSVPALPAHGGGGLSDAELARLVDAARTLS